MAYALLWLELLAIGLLGVTVACAWLTRLSSRAAMLILCSAFTLQTMACWGAVGAGSAHLNLMVAYWVSLSITAIVASVLILYFALRRRDGMPEGRRWNAWRLSTAFAAVLLLHLGTLWTLDTAARGKLAAAQRDAVARMMALVPSTETGHEDVLEKYRTANALIPTDILHIPVPTYDSWCLLKDQNIQWSDPLLADHLLKCAPALEGVRAVSRLPRCDWINGSSPPNELPASDLVMFRELVRLLALDARYQARLGSVEQATQNIDTLYALARHVSQGPTMLAWLQVGYIERIAQQTLESVLQARPQIAQQIDLQAISPTLFDDQQFAWALETESAWQLLSLDYTVRDFELLYSSLTDLFIHPLPDTFKPLNRYLVPVTLYYRVTYLSEDVAEQQRMIGLARSLFAKPFWEVADDLDKVKGDPSSERRGAIAQQLSPTLYPSMRKRAAEFAASHRMSLLLVAAAQYHAKHGKYPVDISVLAAEHPKLDFRDPIDGQPLRMLHKNGGIVFYSIGRDREDDGGTVNEFDDDADIAVGLGTQPAVMATPAPTITVVEPGDS